MANAILDARQEGGSYRRVEVITGGPAETVERGEGPCTCQSPQNESRAGSSSIL